MTRKFFQDRRWLAAVSLTTALAVTGFLGLRAATVNRADNPPATVRVTSQAPSHAGYSKVIKEVLPAVVNISSTKVVKADRNAESPDDFFRQFFGDGNVFGDGGNGTRPGRRQFSQPQERREKGLGSGVIVSPEGYILTNNHVVDGATEVLVTLHDKREMKARVVGTDPRTDIAVLKIEGSNFPTLTLADSSKAEIGDVVLAIGDPFGIGQTVTQGIISATGRSGLGIEEVEDFIQTDASINPGNSGGALVDDQGHLIGINTAIAGGNSGGNVGIGFAVPINMAKNDMDQILAHGKVVRAYMGIMLQDVTPAIARAFNTNVAGGLVGDISPNSPASRSDLKKGDIIVELNGQPIESGNQLRLKVGSMEPGATINLKVLREGKPLQVTLKLAEFPSDQERASLGNGNKESSEGVLPGVSVENLTPEIASELKLSAQTKGVVVDDVSQSSAAAEAGLQKGDVIQEVNHKPVTTASDFRQAVGSASKDSPILLLVNHGGNTMYVAIS
jgi:serine protease Do